ncbi:ChbG/HpnK family deacetylase [Psychrobacter sp. TAE2020]|uniref:ChbG/HpnK family deacetylase n=1 Tax=Psychrobacter sp. TAE2020 TaxID=2846762 RepID=UPI001C1203A6|nr:ChbG/HpnK family deacetylase [Psychrobacter sp. TAE2020]MBU5615890.1 ChbG/HpnK family deacetylase [Psychrobacter sp. TAE2020]
MNNTSQNNKAQNNVSSPPNNARAVIINVDDLGLSHAVNKAVIRLAERGIIGASSYMVGGNISDSDITKLAEMNVDIGLHLDLTGVYPSTLSATLKSLIIASYLRRLKPMQVTEVIQHQLDSFEDKFNRAPAFIDGHQHIHQFPIIRERLIQELTSRYGSSNDKANKSSHHAISARVTTPLVNDFKSWVIYSLGGRVWNKLCRQHNIATNDKFGGVYGFDVTSQQLAALWDKWLSAAPRTRYLQPGLYIESFTFESSGTYAQYGSTTPPIHSVPLSLPRDVTTTLLMCHPAVPDNSWQDEIKGAREREFAWLMSNQFEDLLQQQQVRLVRWSDIVAM